MSSSDIIALMALIISFLSFIASIFSYLISKKTFNIGKIQHEERTLGVDLYFIDTYKWKKEEEIFISFALRFTNHSTLANSISKITLHIEYHDEASQVRKVKLNPITTVTPINLKDYSDVILLPLSLSEKSAKSGWVTYLIPKYINEHFTTDLYKIIAETIDQKTISIDTHIVNEV